MALISVGIPTYNRATTLRRAAGSVLAQTHRELELVISDNASSDDTEAVCRELCVRDGRVRYLRAPANRGPTANFNRLIDEARGEFAMLLSDDDWLEPDYLERCLETLESERSASLVAGRACYIDEQNQERRGALVAIGASTPGARVLEYLRAEDTDGLFYGLMRATTLRAAAPIRNSIGNDWLLVAGIVAQGTATTIPDTAIMRELGGTSANVKKVVTTLGLPRVQALLPHAVIAWLLFAQILWRGEAFRLIPAMRRGVLASRAAFAVLDWRSDAWHATAPTMAAIGRRRGGAPLWRAYLRLTARLGATHDQLPD
ncbi:MAG TPA: glycosyltransferase family 2 protein [Solirubrobacteraceae bacterium]|nr:glycosyltransferase family 2 protein [Solirubrobacteraceae bacterium]